MSDILARYDTAVGQPSVGPDYHSEVDWSAGRWTLADVAKAGGRITRVRWLSDGPRCDLSYVHATLPDGTLVPVMVESGMGVLTWRRKGHLIEWAKRHGVYAKGLGLLDEGNWSTL